MTRHALPLPTTLTAAALLAAALAAVPSASASALGPAGPVITTPFSADAGRPCPAGVTKGVLGWHVGPAGSRPLVDVKGTVRDDPLPTDPSRECEDDGRFTAATFTAYSGGVPVAAETRRADDAEAAVSFSLTAKAPIQQVVIQVCRHSSPPSPLDYCGKPQRYPAPISVAR